MEVLAFVGNAALVVLGISLLIVAHEFGHFIVAKLTGIKVDEFMVGLPGPKIFSFKAGDTTYGMTYLLFGGYVKYAGMDPFERVIDEEEAGNFNAQPAWKKILSVVMGPVMNLVLCAALLIVFLWLGGMLKPTTVIEEALSKYPAKKAGLQSGDEVVAIDGKKTDSWSDVTKNIKPYPDKEVEVEVEREGEKLEFDVMLAKRDGEGFLGIQPRNKREKQPLPTALVNGVKMTGQITVAICKFLYDTVTKKIGLFIEGARGPVGIVVETHRAASRSFFDYIFLLAVLSASLAVFNALPVPPLDGGRLLVFAIESIKGKPVSTKIIMATNAIGVSLLLFLMIYLVIADFQRYLPQFF